MDDSQDDQVATGYDAVYTALPGSPTLRGIWRTHALGADYPEGFEHISFLTLPEMRNMATQLRLAEGSVLVDLGCGMGGPGLWIARETGAQLVGIDFSNVALAHARARALALHLADHARFVPGTFARTGLGDASVDGAISVDALQYAPNKQAAFEEAARILRPGARLVFACFELDPPRVAGLPVLGTDPVEDYRPVLEAAGFDVVSYGETAAWRGRVTETYQAVVDARPALAEEMGETACMALLSEVSVTLQLQPLSTPCLCVRDATVSSRCAPRPLPLTMRVGPHAGHIHSCGARLTGPTRRRSGTAPTSPAFRSGTIPRPPRMPPLS